jgi:predicted acylesterase/phospholipase RssA
MLEASGEFGIKPDFIAGCSIGALLGAAYASGLSAAEIRDHALPVLGTPGKAARQLFWPAANLRRNRFDGRRLAVKLTLMFENHPHRTFAHIR